MEAGHEEFRAQINAGQMVTWAAIRALQRKTEAAISAIRYAQARVRRNHQQTSGEPQR
jgi:hypothetical protein